MHLLILLDIIFNIPPPFTAILDFALLLGHLPCLERFPGFSAGIYRRDDAMNGHRRHGVDGHGSGDGTTIQPIPQTPGGAVAVAGNFGNLWTVSFCSRLTGQEDGGPGFGGFGHDGYSVVDLG